MPDSKFSKMKFAGLFVVASVLFGSHAGGGFATGNQATQYYVQYGWIAPIMATLAMAVLTLTMRECIIMYNTRGLKNYKELFQELWSPYKEIAITFEVYFYIMVVCAVGAVIAGAAALFESLGMNYGISVLVVGAMLLLLTIFGSKLVARASSVMSIIILVCCAVIFILGIKAKASDLSVIFAERIAPQSGYLNPITKIFVYAGFQSVVIPTLVSCSTELKTKKNASRAMFISFIMNAVALALSCLMLLGWYSTFTAAGETTLPSIFICNMIGVKSLYYFYSIALFLCFISTGVTTVFGLVSRFESHKLLSGIKKITLRRAVISALIMVVSMGVSMFGLSNIIKIGYGYCGYFGIIVIILPMLTIGYVKNRKFLKEHPEYIGE